MAAKKTQKKAAGRGPAKVKKALKKVASKVRAKVQPIPKGYHVITPSIVVRGAAEAIEFYKKAFGAKEINRMAGPDGRVMHAEIRIGDSIVMLGDEFPAMGSKSPLTVGGISSSLMIYTEDVDSAYARAIAAGCTAERQPEDQFWGDRMGTLVDPFGHRWSLATHKTDVSEEEESVALLPSREGSRFLEPRP